MLNVRAVLYEHEDMKRALVRAMVLCYNRMSRREAEVYDSLYPSYCPEDIRVSSTPDPDGKLLAALDLLDEIREEYRAEIARLNRRLNEIDAIERVARALPERYRSLVVPRFYEGKTKEEVCAALSISEGEYYRRVSEVCDMLEVVFLKTAK